MNAYDNGGLQDERIAGLMVQALDSKDQELASRAQSAIRGISSDSIRFPSRPALAGLSDPNPKTRITSLSVLGHLDNSPPFDVLLPLLHDPDPEVRGAAERELLGCYTWTSDTRVVPLLAKMLHDPQEWHTRVVINSLSQFRTPESIHSIALLLKDRDLCEDAFDCLHRIGGEKVFEAVIDVLDDVPPDLHRRVEELADWVCEGNYKYTSYWKKHEAANTRALNVQP